MPPPDGSTKRRRRRVRARRRPRCRRRRCGRAACGRRPAARARPGAAGSTQARVRAIGIALRERQLDDPSVGERGARCAMHGAPGLARPRRGSTPPRSSGVRSSSTAIRSGQVALPKRCALQVLAAARRGTRLAPRIAFELAHDDRRLLVDDRAVERAGLAEVVEPLADRVRARRAVDLVGRRVVREQEAQIVIDLRERGIRRSSPP